MMKNLRIDNGVVAEIIDGKLPPLHPDLAKTFVQVPATTAVRQGDLWDGAAVQPAPTPTLADNQLAAKRNIDKAAGEARARYITNEPGQQAVYILKERQAREYKAAGYPAKPVPAMIAADATAMVITPTQAADVIIAQAELWIGLAAQIEAVRMSGKTKIDQATTDADIQKILLAAVTSLANI